MARNKMKLIEPQTSALKNREVSSGTKHVFVREVSAYYRGHCRSSRCIENAKAAKEFFDGIMKENAREQFVALHLDGVHHVVSYSVVSVGTATSTLVHPREVFQIAMLAGACAIIVAHNHPSGGLTPSDEDRRVTKTLVEAGKLLGIPVLDRLIISVEGFMSFAERGELP